MSKTNNSSPKKPLASLKSTAKDKLAQKMLEKRLQRLQKPKNKPPQPRKADSNIPEKWYRFDKYPGYEQIQIIEKGGEQLNIPSPFFKTHEGVASNTTQISGMTYVNFASYNYLDLCGHPKVNQAAQDAISQYGTSASASRAVAGERPIQGALECKLANLYGTEDAIVFVSGHATNVTTIGYLFEPNDLILHDALIHNSALQGILLSGAKRIPFEHNDWQHLDSLLQEHRHDFERVLIIIEGIYSMDGDYPDLPEFIRIKHQHKAFLMVDEAHSLGVMGKTGKGLHEHFDIDPTEVDIWMGTLSKTLASCGGYIAGEKALIKHLKYSAPGFLYSVGISPPIAAASLAALQIMLDEPERVQQLHARGKQFLTLAKQYGIDTGDSSGYSVIPTITGSSANAARLANTCFEQGINVQPIFYPAVAEGMARLRFFICSSHTPKQITQTVEILHQEISKL
ncbi:MAG: 8-amino-7-oxononanoate synthase (EC [uncultured Thiotrichaceae bacterium]|uniref:8-amino-7-oxononanoate synthase (EC) n=1 Tax=uncultured Thiotrichaceae bacterium TaxID=298394 RepID=A0A6S6S9H4_9GAMM|nr:MAG: 8-amino-7-oxononanoate synthase (EC [uncultured Thiotrichaceae bacterium]